MIDPAYYLDNAATTQILPEVLSEALPYLNEEFGNPSSLYSLGARAGNAVKRARESLARSFGVPPQGITFTGSGTESDNLALRGVFRSTRLKGQRLLISAIEHAAVRETAQDLAIAKGPHLHRPGLELHLPHGHLAVAPQGDFAPQTDPQDGRGADG